MNPKENYLHEFFRILFANRQLVKRVFLIFAVIALLLPLVLKQSFDITAQVIVQSKKLSQSDAATGLTTESDKFIPPSLSDMETESNILRSPTLIRETISQLRDLGLYSPQEGLIRRLIISPIRRNIINPVRELVVNPVRELFGLETDPVRDVTLDVLTAQAEKDLKIETLPGSNVISITYSFGEPEQGTMFVARLLDNYLANRQDLQSNDLPQSYYEQKKAQYQTRLDGLQGKRLTLLEANQTADPKEEITFRLNAINTEEQALNQYRDRLLQNQKWLSYLQNALDGAKQANAGLEPFPFTFTTTIDNVAIEDREIKVLGELLTQQVSAYVSDASVFQTSIEPMRAERQKIALTRAQFLKVVANRIRERTNDLAVIQNVIDQKTQRISQYKARVHELQKTQSTVGQLDTELNALSSAFATYTQRFEERSGIDQLDNLSNARVLSPPFVPTEPAFPRPSLIIPFGLLTGLLMGVALVYVREFFDHRFKHPAQLTQQLGLPVLLVINDQYNITTKPALQQGALPKLWHWVCN